MAMGAAEVARPEDHLDSSSDLEEGEVIERELPPLPKLEPRIAPPSTRRFRADPSPGIPKRANYLQNSSFDQAPQRRFREYQPSPPQPLPAYPPALALAIPPYPHPLG
jgi:hypothetical protein